MGYGVKPLFPIQILLQARPRVLLKELTIVIQLILIELSYKAGYIENCDRSLLRKEVVFLPILPAIPDVHEPLDRKREPVPLAWHPYQTSIHIARA